MLSVSFSHKSSFFFPHVVLENSNESWQVAFKSAESKTATFFTSSKGRQAEQRFTLCLSMEVFLQKYAIKHSWILKKNLWLRYLGTWADFPKCVFF